MIRLTLLDRREIALNCDLIAWVTAQPDTTVRMITGETLLVREQVDEVVQRVTRFRSQVLGEAGIAAVLASSSVGATAASVTRPLEQLRGQSRAADACEVCS